MLGGAWAGPQRHLHRGGLLMCRRLLVLSLVTISASLACAKSANVDQERSVLMAVDREWSGSTKDPAKFASYYVQDATMYAPAMARIDGSTAIRDTYTKLSS